jgi:hypothetical protein
VAERRKYKRVAKWDAERLREVLEPLGLWEGVTQVSSAAVRSLLSSPEVPREKRRAIEEAAEYGETSRLNVKEVGGLEEMEETEG